LITIYNDIVNDQQYGYNNILDKSYFDKITQTEFYERINDMITSKIAAEEAKEHAKKEAENAAILRVVYDAEEAEKAKEEAASKAEIQRVMVEEEGIDPVHANIFMRNTYYREPGEL